MLYKKIRILPGNILLRQGKTGFGFYCITIPKNKTYKARLALTANTSAHVIKKRGQFSKVADNAMEGFNTGKVA